MALRSDRFATLARWYGSCDPDRPLDLGDGDLGQTPALPADWYVDLDAFTDEDGARPARLRGRRVVDDLFTEIASRTYEPGAASAQLFAGFRGTGKSTELSRLARRLRDDGRYVVLRFDIGNYHTRVRALTVEELALVLAAGIGETAESRLGEAVLPPGSTTRRLTRFLGDLGRTARDAGLELAIHPTPGFSIGTVFRSSDDLADRLRRLLRHRPDELRGFLHGVVTELADAVSPRQVVVLVDGLDRYSAPVDRVEHVYREMAELFAGHPDLLNLPRCHVVYTVSPYFAFLHPSIADRYGGRMNILASVRVHGRPPERADHPPGIRAMEEVLGRRVDLDALFGPDRPRCVHALARASGGHVRDLFHLAREVIRLAQVQDAELPVDLQLVEDAIRDHRARRPPIFRDTLHLLARVAREGSLAAVDSHQVGELCQAMDHYLLLSYWNGDSWYDVHPLYRPLLPDPSKPEE